MPPQEGEEGKTYTLEEISKHTSQEDCWMIIGNEKNGGPKVYNVTKYLDDHPGGAEVLLDVAGQNADEFFEDIGHSNEARKELQKHYVGEIDPASLELLKASAKTSSLSSSSAGGSGGMMGVAVLALLAVGAAFYMKQQQEL